MREARTILKTERLLLREFLATDVDALATVLSDSETMRYYPAPFDRAGVEEWIERNRTRYSIQGYGLWAMVLKSNEELIGDCGLALQEVEGEKLIEIGYHVRRDLWAKDLRLRLHVHVVIMDFAKLKAAQPDFVDS